MYKIGLIGPAESANAFLTMGYAVMEAHTPTEAAEALHRAADSGEFAVIFIDEALAAAIPSDMARYRSKLLPAITVLPGKNGSMGMGAAAIKSAMERAIGADIL